MSGIWWLVLAAGLLAAGCAWRLWQKAWGKHRLTQAKRCFHAERERLEARFVQLAATRCKSNSPRWADCTFADDVAYVRNRSTGELSAFVALTVATPEFGPAVRSTADTVGNLQAGTAVFRFDHQHWVTDGRAILNLSPGEAVYRFREDLEIVDEDLAHRE